MGPIASNKPVYSCIYPTKTWTCRAHPFQHSSLKNHVFRALPNASFTCSRFLSLTPPEKNSKKNAENPPSSWAPAIRPPRLRLSSSSWRFKGESESDMAMGFSRKKDPWKEWNWKLPLGHSDTFTSCETRSQKHTWPWASQNPNRLAPKHQTKITLKKYTLSQHVYIYIYMYTYNILWAMGFSKSRFRSPNERSNGHRLFKIPVSPQ